MNKSLLPLTNTTLLVSPRTKSFDLFGFNEPGCVKNRVILQNAPPALFPRGCTRLPLDWSHGLFPPVLSVSLQQTMLFSSVILPAITRPAR